MGAVAGAAQVVLDSTFPAGCKVEIQERLGDFYAPGETLTTATVPKDSRLVIEGLDYRQEYWAVGELEDGSQKVVGVTAKIPVERSLPAPSRAQRSAQSRPAGPGGEVITGPRNTRTASKGNGKAQLTEAQKAKKRSEASKKAAATRKRNKAAGK